jgi:L-asparagine transporter-like permease
MARILTMLFLFAVGVSFLVENINEREWLWVILFAVALSLLTVYIGQEVRKLRRVRGR